jgi:NADPH:quinone reductase-like Zn-dependent oxidoreductase
MKAIVCNTYGSPDTLRLVETDKPTAGENQVLVKVHAAAANPLDWHKMRGSPFLVRLGDGFLKPKDPRLGADAAGTVEAVGVGVTEFQIGDAVFGCGSGAFAEYMVTLADNLVHKPARLSFEQAAAVPVAAFTALQGLRDYGHIEAGQKVVINGAAGGVGTFAVQIAKSYGAEVTGVCITRNLELVQSIGADHIIDYIEEDFTRIGQRYDLIFDLVANYPVSDYARALKPGGRCVVGGFSGMRRLLEYMFIGPRVSKATGKHIGMMGIAKENKADLLVMKDQLDRGKIVPVIDHCYSLEETPQAIHHLETGHARGKVIVVVGNRR